jgi:hypothetical protein
MTGLGGSRASYGTWKKACGAALTRAARRAGVKARIELADAREISRLLLNCEPLAPHRVVRSRTSNQLIGRGGAVRRDENLKTVKASQLITIAFLFAIRLVPAQVHEMK